MSTLKKKLRKTYENIKDNEQVKEGIGIVLNAVLAILLRSVKR